MRKLLTILLITWSCTVFGQTDINRTLPVGNNPAVTASYNKQSVRDANLTAVLNLRIPKAASFTINNAKDSVGYIMYNTSINKIGIYKGGGIWDTLAVGSNPIGTYVSTFNGRHGAITPLIGDYSAFYLQPSSITATSPIFYNSSTKVISSQAATSSQNGYLTNADWITFNGKQDALGFTPENVANKVNTVSNSQTTYTSSYAVSHYAYPKSHTDSIVAGLVAITGYVPTSRLISTNAGTGTLGGGNLSGNLTIYNDTATVLVTKTFITKYELLSNKTATSSNSTTTYPNWYGITHYGYPKSHLDSIAAGTIAGNLLHRTGDESFTGVKTVLQQLTFSNIGQSMVMGGHNINGDGGSFIGMSNTMIQGANDSVTFASSKSSVRDTLAFAGRNIDRKSDGAHVLWSSGTSGINLQTVLRGGSTATLGMSITGLNISSAPTTVTGTQWLAVRDSTTGDIKQIRTSVTAGGETLQSVTARGNTTTLSISALNYLSTGSAGNGYLRLLSQSVSPASATGYLTFYSDSLNRLTWKNSKDKRTIRVTRNGDITIQAPCCRPITILADSTDVYTHVPSAAIGNIPYYGSGGNLTSNGSFLYWDPSNTRLHVGANIGGTSILNVSNADAALSSSGRMASFQAVTGSKTTIGLDVAGGSSSVYPEIIFRTGGGTTLGRTATLANTILYRLGQTAFGSTVEGLDNSFLAGRAINDFTDADQANTVTLNSVVYNRTAATQKWLIDGFGNFGIGSASTIAGKFQVFQGTGTSGIVSTVSGSATVNGTQTNFSSTLYPGRTITVNGETRTILSVTSDILATTTANWTGTNTGIIYTISAITPFIVTSSGYVYANKLIVGTIPILSTVGDAYANYVNGNSFFSGTLNTDHVITSTVTTAQLIAAYDGSNQTTFTTNSSGNHTIAASGGQLSVTGILNVSSNLNITGSISNVGVDQANLRIGATQSTVATTNSMYQYGNSSNNLGHVFIGGNSTGTVAVGGNYNSVQIGRGQVTGAASGTNNVFSTLALNTINYNSGAATITNSAGLYIPAQNTFATNNFNLLSMSNGSTTTNAYFKYGKTRVTGFQLDSVASITNSPTTSAGGYEFLTRNTSTGLLEKVASTVTSNPTSAHNISTPTTGGTVNLTNNQYNIINPAGALLALTVNLPSSPVNNDTVYIKYTQSITTVTYGNGTVVDGITSPVGGGLVVLTYDLGTTSWY